MKSKHNFDISFGSWMSQQDKVDLRVNHFIAYIKELSASEAFNYEIKLFTCDEYDNISRTTEELKTCFLIVELADNDICGCFECAIIYDCAMFRHKKRMFEITTELRELIKKTPNIIYLNEEHSDLEDKILYRNYKQKKTNTLFCITI